MICSGTDPETEIFVTRIYHMKKLCIQEQTYWLIKFEQKKIPPVKPTGGISSVCLCLGFSNYLSKFPLHLKEFHNHKSLQAQDTNSSFLQHQYSAET
jgi:hypothetical protein